MRTINKKAKHGFLALPRQANFIINELGSDLFGFYVALVMLARWYRGNPHFGKVLLSQSELAENLQTSQATSMFTVPEGVSTRSKSYIRISFFINQSPEEELYH